MERFRLQSDDISSFFHFAERKVLVVMTRPWEDNGVTKHQPLERDKDYEGNPYLN